MAWGNFVLDKGFKAAAAITKFRAVKGNGNTDEVIPVAASSDVVMGIAQYSVSADEITDQKHASVRMQGISEMEISAAINQNDLVSISANGRAKTAATGERVIGVAMADGAVAGNRIPVALNLPGYLAP